jgi:hypothetical protein
MFTAFAENAKAKAAARVGEIEAQLAIAKAELQPKLAWNAAMATATCDGALS